MKNYFIPAALLGSLLLLSGCGNDAPATEENSAPSADTTVASSQVTSAPDTTAESTSSTASSSATTTSAATSSAVTTASQSSSQSASTTASTTELPQTTTAKPDNNTVPADEPLGSTAGLAGYWYIDGDPFAASIYISSNGRFESYYATGATENTGYIRREFDKLLNNYYYVMYLDDDQVYMVFADDGLDYKTDIYIGNSGFPHYVKLFGEGGLGDDGRGEDEDDFAGDWQCDRAHINIVNMGEGIYHAVIRWSDSASAFAQWEYSLIYNGEELVSDGNGVKSYVEYYTPSGEPDITVEYTDGAASFNMTNEGLTWQDMKENSGAGMVFTREYYYE